MSLFCQS